MNKRENKLISVKFNYNREVRLMPLYDVVNIAESYIASNCGIYRGWVDEGWYFYDCGNIVIATDEEIW